MPRPPNISMKTTNLVLDLIRDWPAPDGPLPPESALAKRHNVSRTAMKAAFQRLEVLGVVGREGGRWMVRRRPQPADYYQVDLTESRSDLVERRFLELALTGDLLPGQTFFEAELARRVGVSTVSVREFLIGFSRYGVIERLPRSGWRLCAFDEPFARELAATRRTFEMGALDRLCGCGPDDPVWPQIEDFARRHRAFAACDDEAVLGFPRLDREFHTFLVAQLHNRFARSFYDIVSFVFHYHYQWSKADVVQRYRTAIAEHLEILDALQRRDFGLAARNLDRHLATSVRTLLASAINNPGAPGEAAGRRRGRGGGPRQENPPLPGVA